jgi:hypothetical protein
VPTFEPPVVYDVPTVLPTTRGPARDLFRWYAGGRARGLTVLKEDGEYVVVSTPTSDRCDAAEEVYLGGHIYPITEAQATALTAAGLGEGVTP